MKNTVITSQNQNPGDSRSSHKSFGEIISDTRRTCVKKIFKIVDETLKEGYIR